MRFAAFVFCMVLTTACVHGATLHVPSEYPGIQNGLDAAAAGDTVLVASGTYFEHLIMKSDVTLRGETGNPSGVIVDGGGTDRVLVANDCGASTRIEGLTLQNGYAWIHDYPMQEGGAGIKCIKGELRIAHVAINDNLLESYEYYYGYGGGVYCESAAIHLTDVEFAGNRAVRGGGLYCKSCQVIISDSAFNSNLGISPTSGFGAGGGIFSLNSYLWIQDGEFRGNTAGSSDGPASGGAIRCWGGALELSGTMVAGNDLHGCFTGVTEGGGVACRYTDAAIYDTHFRGNTMEGMLTESWGAGLSSRDGTLTLDHCCFFDNKTAMLGGAIYLATTGAQLTNITCSENVAIKGGGICIQQPGQLEYCLVSFAKKGGGVWSGPDLAQFQHCDVYGNTGGDFLGGMLDPTGVDGNISVDPQFCGEPGSGNLYLQSDSPCCPETHGVLIGCLGVNCGTVATETTSFSRLKSMF
ncbi:MAG: hypothetical protein GY835_07545 [bacterium]|nr:hypothetical protein [bacterium]